MLKKASVVIAECLEKKGMTQRQLASCMGEDVRNLNQQMHRQKDFRVSRFDEVLQHIGFRLTIQDMGGARKVSHEYADKVIETSEPAGKFYTFAGGVWTGIDNSTGNAWTEDFDDFDELMKWLKGQPCFSMSGEALNV